MTDGIECPRCGADVTSDANFCPTCGLELPSSPVSALTEQHPVVGVGAEDEVPMLVVTRGATAGSRYAAAGPTTSIGRHPDSGVFLDDVSVSRRHAELRRSGGALSIVDNGSLNGTYVNGQRIEAEVSLVEGDQIQVGKFKLVFVVGGHGGDA